MRCALSRCVWERALPVTVRYRRQADAKKIKRVCHDNRALVRRLNNPEMAG